MRPLPPFFTIVPIVVVLALAGCSDPSVPPSPSTSSSASPAATPGASPSAAASVDTRPVVGDIELSPMNVRCTFVPNGNLDGSDSLTVFAYILLIGANQLPGPLHTEVAMSNGFSTTYTGAPHNQAAAYFQGPVRSGDWGRDLTVRITSDSDDVYRESSESNNAISVAAHLPASRPNQTVDPLSCTASRV